MNRRSSAAVYAVVAMILFGGLAVLVFSEESLGLTRASTDAALRRHSRVTNEIVDEPGRATEDKGTLRSEDFSEPRCEPAASDESSRFFRLIDPCDADALMAANGSIAAAKDYFELDESSGKLRCTYPLGVPALMCKTWLQHAYRNTTASNGQYRATFEERPATRQLVHKLTTSVYSLSARMQFVPWERAVAGSGAPGSGAGAWTARRLDPFPTKFNRKTFSPSWSTVSLNEGGFGLCALVGRNPVLLQQRWGAEIDSHDTVVREDVASSTFAAYTGSKTSFLTRLASPGEQTTKPARGFLIIDETVALANPQLDPETLESLAKISRDGLEILVPSEDALDAVRVRFDFAMEKVFASGAMKTTPKRKPVPSPGIIYALWMLPLCDRLDLYGFNSFPSRPVRQGDLDDASSADEHDLVREGVLLYVLSQNSPKVSVRK